MDRTPGKILKYAAFLQFDNFDIPVKCRIFPSF